MIARQKSPKKARAVFKFPKRKMYTGAENKILRIAHKCRGQISFLNSEQSCLIQRKERYRKCNTSSATLPTDREEALAIHCAENAQNLCL